MGHLLLRNADMAKLMELLAENSPALKSLQLKISRLAKFDMGRILEIDESERSSFGRRG